ncbi:hypothetical protein [uncultured Marivita sp.]|uniref:hypothetical protein n=1 Tax=uncultured Marivita sp. TaxID=888080 RepID=UPI0026130D77|nr:hypothetical protein [uncultured Marivita sp.]
MITRSFNAGLVYGLSVFALGFGLGVLRTLLLHPLFGEVWAVALEIPVMLAASWIICATLVHRLLVPSQWSDRLTMGGVALACVLVGEALVSVGLFERTLAEYLALYGTPRSALGLLAQIAFALMPVAQLRRDRKGD